MNNLFKKGFASLALMSAMVLLLFGSWLSANDGSTSVWHKNEMPLMFALKKPNSDEKILFHLVAGKLTIEASKQNHMIVLTAKRLGSESMKPLTYVVNRPHSDQKIYLSVHDNKIAIRDTKNEKIHLFYDTGLSSATSATLITNEPAYKIALQSGKSLLFSVIHAKPSVVATTTVGKVINQNTSTATNILDANKYGKALASSVIYAKDSVVATTTVGTAANNTYIINANSDLDVNNSGEVLSFSVLDTKPSVVTAANNNINSTSSNVNTGNNISFVKSFENTFMIENNTENEVIYNLAGANNVTNLKNNTATTAANTAATMNNTEKTKTKKVTISANSLFNSDTFGSFAAIASDNGEFKIMTHYTLSA